MEISERAERSVLGAILLDNEQYFECVSLDESDFGMFSHRILFAAMRRLLMAGTPVDIVTLVTELDRENNLRKIGDVAYVSSLIDGNIGLNARHYSSVVRDCALRRSLTLVASGIKEQCEDNCESTQDCLSVAIDRILKLAGNDGKTQSLKVSEYSYDVFAKVKKLANLPLSELPVGLPTGICGVDHITTGLRECEFWVIASWTGEGKTVLLTQVISENAKRGIPVLWFTQEMSRKQVLLRMIPALTNGVVKGRHLRDPRNMTRGQLMTFEKTQAVLDQWPLWVSDAASLEITHLFAHAMAMVRRHKIGLIAVDYIQLVKGRGDKRYEQITDVSNQLRELAKMTEVPVVAVSQLSKPDNRSKRPPTKFDMKESGSIEQDAHVILLPYRPQDKDGHFTGDDLIIVDKQREGPTGSVKVRFDSLTLTFQPKDGEDHAEDSMF